MAGALWATADPTESQQPDERAVVFFDRRDVDDAQLAPVTCKDLLARLDQDRVVGFAGF